MDSQEKCSSARTRPAAPMTLARAGSDTTSLRAAAKSRDKLFRIQRGAGTVRDLLQFHQQSCFAVLDHFGDAAGGAGHHGCATCHGLEVDDAEGLVDRRAGEGRGMAEHLDELVPRKHPFDDQDHLRACPAGPR